VSNAVKSEMTNLNLVTLNCLYGVLCFQKISILLKWVDGNSRQ
jgi:hypothetical protein